MKVLQTVCSVSFYQMRVLIYLILYGVKTLQESLKSLTIVRTETETDARVDRTIRKSHKESDRTIKPKATRQAPGKEI